MNRFPYEGLELINQCGGSGRFFGMCQVYLFPIYYELEKENKWSKGLLLKQRMVTGFH